MQKMSEKETAEGVKSTHRLDDKHIPELGNLIFGHSRGEYPIKRHIGFENLLNELFEAIDAKRNDETMGYGFHYENEIFYTHPYCWCEKDDCPQCGTGEQYNFYFKLGDFGINWYKYPLRDAYSNHKIILSNFAIIIERCKESLSSNGQCSHTAGENE